MRRNERREARWLVIKHYLLEAICYTILIGLLLGGFYGILWLCHILGA